MKNITIKIKDKFPKYEFLGARDSGEKIREIILPLIKEGNKVILDFEGFKTVSHAFSDETLGIFVSKFGVNFIKDNITLINTSENIKTMLNFAIRERVGKLKQSETKPKSKQKPQSKSKDTTKGMSL